MTVALVTTLNEAATIGSLVAGLREVVDRVLVVDDPRSTDNTMEVAEAFGAETLLDIEVSGIGPCLMAGLRRLAGERVVVIDAGGSHSVASIPLMLKAPVDVVIGSRFVPGAAYRGRAYRAWLSKWYSAACSVKTGVMVHDWTSGFRVYSPEAVRAVLSRPPTARMHGFQPQSLASCIGAGMTVREYPISYLAGRSSMNPQVAWEATRALGGLPCL